MKELAASEHHEFKEAEALEKTETAHRIRELQGRIDDLEGETETLKQGQSADAAEKHEKDQAEKEATSLLIREKEEKIEALEEETKLLIHAKETKEQEHAKYKATNVMLHEAADSYNKEIEARITEVEAANSTLKH